MNALICPNCNGTLYIEHYNIKLPQTQAFGLSSRLVCKKCPYKREPKKTSDPRVAELIRNAEKDDKRPKTSYHEKKRSTINISSEESYKEGGEYNE